MKVGLNMMAQRTQFKGYTVVGVPPEEWSQKARHAASRKPESERPNLKSRIVDAPILDLARVEYMRQERKVCGANSTEVGSGPLVLDFSRAKMISAGVLPILGSLIKYRSDRRQITQLHLPIAPEGSEFSSVVDYMRTWCFGEFVEEITGYPMTEFLTSDSLMMWERWSPAKSSYVRTVPSPDGSRVHVLSKNYVSLMRLNVEDMESVECSKLNDRRYRAGQIASLRVEQWTTTGTLGPLLKKRIVDRQGRPASELIGATILNELLINSLIHPHSSRVYTYGQFCPSTTIREQSYFVLSVWDDGDNEQSLPEVLSKAIAKRKATSPAYGHVQEVYRLWEDGRFIEESDFLEELVFTKYGKQRKNAPFIALMAGVTSEPTASKQGKGLKLEEDNLPENYQGYPGLGLYRVKLAAVQAIGGCLQYAGSTYRNSIRGARRKDSREGIQCKDRSDEFQNERIDGYRVDIQSNKQQCWPLAGNLWTVWVPVKSTTE